MVSPGSVLGKGDLRHLPPASASGTVQAFEELERLGRIGGVVRRRTLGSPPLSVKVSTWRRSTQSSEV